MKNYVFKSLNEINVFDLETGYLEFVLDQLQNTTWSNGVETVDLTGANGVIIASYDRNKTSSISGTNALICGGLLASQVGTDVISGEQTIENYLEYVTLTSADTVATKFAATGTTGAEIKAIYKYDGTPVRMEATQGDTAGADTYAYNPSTKELTLPTNMFKAGDQLVIQYNYTVQDAQLIVNSTDNFAGNHRVEAICTYQDMCTKKEIIGKIIFPVAKVDGNFDIEGGDTPAVHNFGFKAIADVCSVNKELWKEFIYE